MILTFLSHAAGSAPRRRLPRGGVALRLGFLLALVFATAPAAAQDLFGLGGNADQAQRRQAELNVRINQLEGQMRGLNGQIEQLNFQIRQLQDLIGRMQKDYDYRLQEIENGAAAAPKRPAKRTEVAPQPAAEEEAPGPVPPAAIGRSGAAAVAAVPYPAPAVRAGPGAPPQVIGQLPADADPIGGVIGGPGGGPLDLSVRRGGAPAAAADADSDLPPGVRLGPSAPGAPRTAATVPTVPPRFQNVPAVASPGEEYDAAYGYILNGEYALAETSFRTFLANHPTDRRVGSAQYWLGESFYARTMNREAADAFLKSYTQYPDGPKAPDSLLKLGLSLQGLGERKAACTTFDELLAKYPRASKQLRDRAQGEKTRGKC